MDKAFCTPADEVLRALGGDRHRGLDEEAVRASREAHGANELARPEPIGWCRRIVEAFKEPMILLLVLALLIMVGVNVAHLLTDGHTEFAACVGVALAILLLCAATAGAAILQPPAPPVPPVARTLPSGESAEMVPAHLSQPSLSLLPFLQVYVDTTGEMDVEEVAALAPDKNFAPLDVKRLPRVTGVTWLRFVLDAAAPGQESSAILLDMGESVPGTPTLYNPLFDTLSNSVEWRENTPTSRNVLLLPRAGAEAQVFFLRLDGLPGLWF